MMLADTAITLTLGTERAGNTPPAETLTIAAVSGARARAGFVSNASVEPIPVCPADDRSPSTASAAARLAEILRTNDTDLLREWAHLANAAGLRAPAHLIADMLRHAVGTPFRPNPVFECLGTRGPWLAALDPRYAQRVRPASPDESPEHVWQTGTTADRDHVLRTLRENDPALGLELIRSTWNTDAAAERAKFLEAMSVGLGATDEAFLEAALEDRSKAVRRAAADLLADLPGSAFQTRMTERLESVIRLESRKITLKRTARLTIVPPTAFDPAWERDGIDIKPPQGIGERAWWLRQIITFAPLEAWERITGLDPQGVIDALRPDDSADDADEAILANLTRRPIPRWVAPTASVEFARKHVRLHLLSPLWSALPPIEAEQALKPILDRDTAPPQQVLALLSSAGWAWSPDFSRSALQLAHKHRKAPHGEDYLVRSWLWQIAGRIDPSALELFEKLIKAMYPELTPKAFESLERARSRAEMHKEFAP
jgi:hypothetical protein